MNAGSHALPYYCLIILLNKVNSCSPAAGSQDSKDGLSVSAKGQDDEKPPSMPEETGKSKVASWLTSQGLKKVSKIKLIILSHEIILHPDVSRCHMKQTLNIFLILGDFCFNTLFSLQQETGDKRCAEILKFSLNLIGFFHLNFNVTQNFPTVWPAHRIFLFCSQIKTEQSKKQDVMTLSDSDDVQTISSGSEDNKEREKATPGKRS